MDNDWVKDAACKDAPNKIFFSNVRADQARAKQYCARCPVRDQCFQYAIEREQARWSAHGIWGGMLPAERWEEKGRQKGFDSAISARTLNKHGVL